MAFEKLAGHGNALLGFFQLKQMRRFRDEIVVHFIGGPLVERGQVRVRQGGVGADDLLRTGDKIEIEQRKETPAVFHELRFVFTGAEEFDPRAARILPLSGKSHAALGELAGEYRSWLDDHAEELSEEGETLDQLLADMTWTAGIGRSHFTHRAGVVFSDAGSLRDGLEALVEAGEGSEPRVAAKAAFVYTGQDSQRVGMGEALYRSEPVIRVVLDQCDAWLQEERGVSLLDVMFGRADSKGSLDDPAWAQPAIYALECALTAWWLSMGVRPSAVIGHDLGEIAAAQAAGVFSLKDGLLFAAARGADELETIFSDIAIAPPSITLISSTMGRTVGPDEILDATYWREQASKPAELKKCAEALSDFGIEGLVEIGPREAFDPMLASAWPESAGDAGEPALISSLHEPSGDEPVEDIYRKFMGAVAEVYEAGLPISFQGCSRERHGAESHCRAIRSSAVITG
ncbi:MAG: acyltransferase domain-containing protein [Gammaproteobacteria bacterium]|nr:acyltransferase domain-containing protein [Gammaproteobacteria bacterium]